MLSIPKPSDPHPMDPGHRTAMIWMPAFRTAPRTVSQESKTDETTVDLDSVLEMERTAFADPQPVSSGGSARQAVEANIILIAHPHNEMLGTRYRLPPRGKLSIGRSSAADISMPEVQSLSRNHAVLTHRGPTVEVEDLRSTNGTYVNDRRVASPQPLRSGDRFQIGAAHFKFLHEQDPEHAYHEAIYHLVMTDGLTQAFNKRKLDEELAREFARALRHERPLSVILFDIDHFKEVNDTFGHLCGDFVLQQIARLTTERLRPEQVFARAGGEEFVILSPEVAMPGSRDLAEKLRALFAAETFRYADVEVNITCSFGVAALQPGMQRPDELYDAADRAMYLSKGAGRDRVTCSSPTR
ncbi:MAG: GGDEF domain-containing protein [Acidobacteriota bacterium]